MLLFPMCYNCKNFTPDAAGGPFVCKAFPAGIPPGIVQSAIDHREPVADDHGIRYDPINPGKKVGPFEPQIDGVTA